MSPHWQDVVLGVLSVLIGCLAAAWSFWVARRHKNPLAWVPGVGSIIFVAGVLGQMSPSDSAETVWTANATVPLIGVNIDMVAVAGLLIGLLGLSLVMFFERVIPEEEMWQPPTLRPFDEDDAV